MNTNAGISKYCQLHQYIDSPNLKDYNRLQAKAFSHLLSQLASTHSPAISSIESLVNSLIPYQRLDFAIPSFSETSILAPCSDSKLEAARMAQEVFSPQYYFTHTTRREGVKNPHKPNKHLGSAMFFRGSFSQSDLQSALG
jgi:hypothetical protein